MKGKKLLSALIAGAMTLGMAVMPAFAETNSPDWDNNTDAVVVAKGIGTDGADCYFKTINEAFVAVYNSNPGDKTVEIECKPSANLGQVTHAVVADNLKIIGNGAYIPSGEHDMQLDTYKLVRGETTTANQGGSKETGEYLTKDIKVEVENLVGISAWGERHTNNAITLIFKNCQNMNRIMFNSKNYTGAINITLDNCSFEDEKYGNIDSSVYTNHFGTISITNCSFKGIAVPINLNNKSDGKQNVTISGCTFTNCSTEEIVQQARTDESGKADLRSYAAPIRFVTQNGASTDVTIDNCTITNETGKETVGNGDILLGDGRNGKNSTAKIALSTKNTKAEIQLQYPDSETIKQNVSKADVSEIVNGGTIEITPANASVSTRNTKAVQIGEDKATGFVTTITADGSSAISPSKIMWTVTSNGTVGKTVEFSLNKTEISGSAQIGLVISGLYDENATAVASVLSAN